MGDLEERLLIVGVFHGHALECARKEWTKEKDAIAV